MMILLILLNIFLWQYGLVRCFKILSIFQESILTQLILTFIISITIISNLFVLSLFIFIPFNILIVFLSIVSLGIYLKTPKINTKQIYGYFKDRLNYEGLVVLSLTFVITLLFIWEAHKWGGWDSFAIWSQHAKFLTFNEYWRNYLDNSIPWCHPDYPLLLSSYIAIAWKGLSIVTGVVPSMISYMFLVLIPLIAYSCMKSLKMKITAVLFFIIIAFDSRFIEITAWLNADTVLSFFYMLSLIIYFHRSTNENYFFILGFIVASCGWIKNEGNLYFLIFSGFLIFGKYKQPTLLLKYFIGALFPLLMIFLFKIFYAPVNDIVNGQSNSNLAKLFEFNRYSLIFKFFIEQLFIYYKVLVLGLVAVLIFNKAYFRSFPFGVLFFTLAGYYFVYVVTPNDLLWHLSTSCERLFHQLYPSFLISILYSIELKNLAMLNSKLPALYKS